MDVTKEGTNERTKGEGRGGDINLDDAESSLSQMDNRQTEPRGKWNSTPRNS